MPLAQSQLVKCVLITAKVWMNMSSTKDGVPSNHTAHKKEDLPPLDALRVNPQRTGLLAPLPRMNNNVNFLCIDPKACFSSP